jgi:tRNA (guanine26-N2/guanine27-N2)-dimethyltransferase
VVANDLNPRAVESIKRNCELNSISEDQVSTAQGDALALMMRSAADNNLFDVIDLDPFGTPAPMLSASLHAVANGGLLCITCTDMRVMTGLQPDVCFAR